MKNEMDAAHRTLLEDAYRSLRHLRAELERQQRAQRPEPIAIVGMSCRFPGAADLQAYWKLLRAGNDAIGEVPSSRWDVASYYAPLPAPNKMNTKWGGFLSAIDEFDGDFFQISPREAASMDPQQRLLLEVVHEALENGGLVPAQLAGSNTGVFVGVATSDYGDRVAASGGELDAYWSTGNARSIAANRISYVFDFKGPSLSIDTACSSSLSALHLACVSLQRGECDTALVGGANIILSPAITLSFSQGGATSPTGRCRPFDAAADGMVRSEGIAVVVLKPLSRALADGDGVYAVIKSSAINQDGRKNGLTAPNPVAQEAVIRAALEAADVEPDDLQYIETHGTGTLLGDPIEARALARAIGRRPGAAACLIGSVKSNLGHTEAVAGLASVIKVALSIKYGEIPASIHYRTPNPHVDLAALGLRVVDRTTVWPAATQPRVAGVSSFGFGGANAHVVMAQAPAPPQTPDVEHDPSGTELLLPISACSKNALTDLADAYLTLLRRRQPSPDALRDICFTAAARRNHYQYRMALTFRDGADAVEKLQAFIQGKDRPGVYTNASAAPDAGRLALVFSGHRAAVSVADFDYLMRERASRDVLLACDRLVQELAGWSLLAFLHGDAGREQVAADTLARLHPLLFVHQVACAALLRHWGIRFDAVIGHSLGEVAAAHVAGSLDLRDAMTLVVHRSSALQQGARERANAGAMLAAELSAEEAARVVDGSHGAIAVAAYNGPTSVVMTGDRTAICNLAEQLRRRGCFCRILDTPGAGHSVELDARVDEFVQAIGAIAARAPQVPFYSTVFGSRYDDALGAPYWRQNLRQPVRFADAVAASIAAGVRAFLEVAPYPPLLCPGIAQCARAVGEDAVVLPALRRNASPQMHFIGALAALYCRGQSPQGGNVWPGGKHDLDVPTYRWQRRRYWSALLDGSRTPQDDRLAAAAAPSRHPLLGVRVVGGSGSEVSVWDAAIDVARHPYLRGHRVQGATLFPGAGYIDLALAAAAEAWSAHACRVANVRLVTALFLREEETYHLRVNIIRDSKTRGRFQISSRAASADGGEQWIVHTDGNLLIGAGRTQQPSRRLPRFPKAASQVTEGSDYYRALRARGAEYEGVFRGIDRIWRNGDQALAQLRLDASIAHDARYAIHPAALDACFQTLGAALLEESSLDPYLPIAVDRCEIMGRALPEGPLWAYAKLRANARADRGEAAGDIALFGADGIELARVRGLRVTRDLARADARRTEKLLYELTWIERALPADPAGDDARGGAWLIFGDGEYGERMWQSLERHGVRAVMVKPGGGYRRIADQRYEINPESPGDYVTLFKSVGLESGACNRVVHMWSLGVAVNRDTDAARLLSDQRLGVISLVYLIQALAPLAGATLRVSVVSHNAQRVEREDSLAALAASPLWGFGRVVLFEHPQLHYKMIDIAGQAAVDPAALRRELAADDAETHVALRTGRRYVARVHVAARRAQAPRRTPFPRLRSKGWYVITGGLGGLGLVTATWLVENGCRHIALIGRTPPTASANEALAVLRKSGATVSTYQADVTDESQVARVLGALRVSAPLRGIIHAAGTLHDGLITQLGREQVLSVMRTKICGAWALHTHTLSDKLDFFVAYSSVASLFGSPGQANYAAANSFLDALCQHRAANGLPALSVGWGPWDTVGGLARTGGAKRVKLLGFNGITPDTGMTALQRLLAREAVHTGVIDIRWRTLFEMYPLLREGSIFVDIVNAEDVAGLGDVPPHTRQTLLALPAQQLGPALEAYLHEEICRTIAARPAEIDARQPLNTMGIDSLMALETKNRVESRLGVSVPIVKFLEGLSIAQLAAALAQQLLAQTRTAPEDHRVSSSTLAVAPLPPRPAPGADLTPQELLAKLETLADHELDELLTSLLAEARAGAPPVDPASHDESRNPGGG